MQASGQVKWSGWGDLNSRPPAPKAVDPKPSDQPKRLKRLIRAVPLTLFRYRPNPSVRIPTRAIRAQTWQGWTSLRRLADPHRIVGWVRTTTVISTLPGTTLLPDVQLGPIRSRPCVCGRVATRAIRAQGRTAALERFGEGCGKVTPIFVIGASLEPLAAPLDLPVVLLAAVGCVAAFVGAANAPLACTVMGCRTVWERCDDLDSAHDYAWSRVCY